MPVYTGGGCILILEKSDVERRKRGNSREEKTGDWNEIKSKLSIRGRTQLKNSSGGINDMKKEGGEEQNDRGLR